MMQDKDLISRSELIAQLEEFKINLADIFFCFVVDRVIKIVQDMPAAERRAKNG